MSESTVDWIRAGHQDTEFRKQAILALGEGFCPHHHERLTPIHRMSPRSGPLWSTHWGCDGVWALQQTDLPREGHPGQFVQRVTFRVDIDDFIGSRDYHDDRYTISLVERRAIVDLPLPEEPTDAAE